MARRVLIPIVLLSALLHGVGIARSTLPAQDGLKFLRVARQFHSQPWTDVIRSCDQHPLYPASIAIMQPLVGVAMGGSPDSWRITAQLVSVLASITLLWPLYSLARSLFNSATAALSSLLFVLLPVPAAIGHDTLSDPLALLAFVTALSLGERALRTRRMGAALGCGVAAGLGYLARPEVAVVPAAVVLTALVRSIVGGTAGRSMSRRFLAIELWVMSVGLLVLVGSYAVVKGELSEKLSIRRTAAIPSTHDGPNRVRRRLPAGLDDPRWDFSAKEESDDPARLSLGQALAKLGARWAESMGLLLVPMMAWGLWRVPARRGRHLMVVYAGLFTLLLVRHAMMSGYLSSRHTLSLVILALPFAAAGILDCVRMVRAWREWRCPGSVEKTPALRVTAVAVMLTLAIAVQWHHAPHPSRWGHGEAGRWLALHAASAEKVLDTRGWATFVSGRTGLDYWHVKQALMDPALAYVVVGEDERTAPSGRGQTLRALLAYAAEPVAEFPEREGGKSIGVRVYRFHPPADWKGMTP